MRHLSALGTVLSSPRASREAIVESQARRLRRLVWHAWDNVPYYRSLFERAGLHPGDIRSLDDLCRIPISPKAQLVAAPAGSLFARGTDPRGLIVRRTSGSSGPIFTMARSLGEELVSEAHQIRIRRYYGLRTRDIQVVALMDTRTVKSRSRAQRLAERFGIHRTVTLSPLLPPAELERRLAEIRPAVVLGLAGPIARLAREAGTRLRDRVRPKHVITQGEVLTAAMRRDIAHAFGARVYDKYVCAEVGHIAYECIHTGEMHTCDDTLVVEVVRDGRPVEPGQRGELVATSLDFHAMPFIRYKLADVVTRGAEVCGCGEPFSTIRAVQGRMIDYFHLPDGRTIHPYELGGAMQRQVTWVKEFQLVQERRDLIVAQIVPGEMPAPEEIEQATNWSRQLFGDGVELRMTLVDRIEPGSTGKLRPFRSKVRSDYDGIDWDAVGSGEGIVTRD